MKLTSKRIKKHIKLTIIGTILLLGVLVLIDVPNIQQDIYNYEQIQKIRNILDAQTDKNYQFKDLVEFNKKYLQSIMPKDNCYYIRSERAGNSYIIGYKYTSFFFSLFSSYYIFPTGKEPHGISCDSAGCFDVNFNYFMKIISNPCKE